MERIKKEDGFKRKGRTSWGTGVGQARMKRKEGEKVKKEGRKRRRSKEGRKERQKRERRRLSGRTRKEACGYRMVRLRSFEYGVFSGKSCKQTMPVSGGKEVGHRGNWPIPGRAGVIQPGVRPLGAVRIRTEYSVIKKKHRYRNTE